jgi:hypothetical protein
MTIVPRGVLGPPAHDRRLLGLFVSVADALGGPREVCQPSVFTTTS